MIKFLICGNEHVGIAEGHERGWERIAFARFATENKDDVRVVRRFSDFPAPAGKTALIRGKDFDDNPDAERFEQFVKEGHGVWVDG